MRLHAFAICVALAAWGCGKELPAPQGTDGVTAAKARKAPEVKVPPYAYPAPVKGHIKETNIGEFDLVDGVAYPSMNGGTVVYVVSKAIASPMLVDSVCPLTQARALAKLRNASFGEITLDPAGRVKYFAAGTPFGGSLTDLTPRGIMEELNLRRPVYHATAAYGHFGREEEGFTWEKSDRAESLRNAAGV